MGLHKPSPNSPPLLTCSICFCVIHRDSVQEHGIYHEMMRDLFRRCKPQEGVVVAGFALSTKDLIKKLT